jgi:hypothetical protein
MLGIAFFFTSQGFTQSKKSASSSQAKKKLTLERAAMCEEIKDLAPHNPAVVFSIKIGKVSCFTSLDPVPKKTFVYHKWFHRDKPSTTKRLTLNPPRWSTYSSIQLRETDKGPWRVEIYDNKGNLLHILRFSITD